MADLYMLMTETAAGPLSVRGNSLVLDDVRPRRHHHRAGDAVARSRAWRAACCAGSPRTRPRPTIPPADAQPGKILHEMRGGEMAALREVPFGLYYGSVDSTPLFVMLAGRLCAAHRRPGRPWRSLWPAIERALGWIDGPGDSDRDGFVEYFRMSEDGLANQGWKDSARCDLPRRRPRSPKGRSRSPRCRATSTPPSGWPQNARASLGLTRAGRAELDDARGAARRALRGGLLVRGDRHLRARARRRQASRAGCAPRTPAKCCSPASCAATAPPRLARRTAARRTSSPAGGSARCPRRSAATTRCPITTARSGRTTMR